MIASHITQITGNVCVGLAVLVLLFPLRRKFWDFASQHPSDDRWTTPVLGVLIPLWLLLMVALLCMAANGGFDWLRLSRPVLYTLTVGVSVALASVTFVFIALYIRPGFTPRAIFAPGIYLTPLSTGLMVVSSLNQELAPGIPLQWLRWPWTIFVALSLVVCAVFVGHRLKNTGFGVHNIVRRVLAARDFSAEHLDKIATLDPQRDFNDILPYATQNRGRAVREAATARLRKHPDFLNALAANLTSHDPEHGLEFLPSATLSPDEQARLALPVRTAIERFIADIPASNYLTRERQKQLLKWGRKTFPAIIGKFTGTDVDFSKVMPAFEHALRLDDTRRR